MSSCSNREVRRCRPLLGTFVEIAAAGLPEARLQRSIEAAFARIEQVQGAMSVHDSASELSRLNEAGLQQSVKISAETFCVLQRGLDLSRESDGAFDFTVAPLLARWGLLPASLRRRAPGDWRDVRLLSRQRVRFTRPLAIDLGGIAKGYAVDAAIEVLRQANVPSALVNAGGDLRVFGSPRTVVQLRHPLHPSWLAHSLRVPDGALATSSPCFTQQHWHRRPISHLINPRTRRAVTGGLSVTVRARECWLADALTKVVLNAPVLAERLLAKHAAEAFVLVP